MPKMTETQFRKKYPDADSFNPGWGYYINFLKVDNLVILPVFGIEEDQKAISLINKFYDNPELCLINCEDLSMEGGLIGCVTWGMKD
jgi:agmatine/peptidylarginine deiminase